jgi:hypothetical protein
MKLTMILFGGLVAGCAVDGTESTSSAEQAATSPWAVSGAGGGFVGTTQGAPWASQWLSISRFVDGRSVIASIGFGGGWQDPSSLTLGPWGYYYAAGYVDHAYGEIPIGDLQVSTERARLRTTVPANSDAFYSERCFYDHRTGSRDCRSHEGATIDVTWNATGEQDVEVGPREFDLGANTLVVTGRTTFSLANATGTLVGQPLQNEVFTYLTSDHGAAMWVEPTTP